jgi:hypothetical protein
VVTNCIRRIAIGVVLLSAFSGIASAQRVDARRSGVAATLLPRTYVHAASEATVAGIEAGARPDLRQHALYGALGGVALWGVYFALPVEADAARSERILVLPSAMLAGATVGFVVGLVRRAF